MAKPPKDRRPGQGNTFFITASTWQGRALFFSERMAQLFLECLYRYREQGKYLLHEFVVMPNHFHAIVTPADGITLERTMQFIKGGFSYEVGRQSSRSTEAVPFRPCPPGRPLPAVPSHSGFDLRETTVGAARRLIHSYLSAST